MSEDSKETNDSGEEQEEGREFEIDEDKNLQEKQEIKLGKPVVIKAEAYKTIIL